MVKIEAKKLAEFISVGTLGGKFPTVVLDFREEGLCIQSKEEDNTIMNVTLMSKDEFESYEVKGLVGIKSSVMVLDLLKSFKDIITLNITKDLFTIYNDKKSASLKTANINSVSFNYMPKVFPVFDKFDEGVKIDSEILKTVLKNSKIIGSEHVSIVVDNKVLKLETGDAKFDRITEKIDCDYHNVSSEFNIELFRKGVNVLKGDVVISIPGDNYPILLTHHNGVIGSRIILSSNGKPSEVRKIEKKVEIEIPKKVEVEVETPKKVTTDTSISDLVGDLNDIKDVDVDINMDLDMEDDML